MDTDEKILRAAEAIFLQVGFNGARMQAIADEAGINKALLHYYFKSKRVLFERVVENKMHNFFPQIGALLFSSRPFIEKMEVFVEKYIQFLMENPLIPNFVIQTANFDPEFINRLPSHMIEGIVEYIQAEIDAGNIQQVQPRQFILSILGMCVFPFLARPIATKLLLRGKQAEFDLLMQNRIEEVQRYVRRILEK